MVLCTVETVKGQVTNVVVEHQEIGVVAVVRLGSLLSLNSCKRLVSRFNVSLFPGAKSSILNVKESIRNTYNESAVKERLV
jgi:hypothetical protein